MAKNENQIRQGDILFVKVAESKMFGKDAKKVKSGNVAEGEIPGHVHHVVGGEVMLAGDTMFVVAGEDTTLTHPDHDTLKLDKGVWKVYHQRESDPLTETIRQVRE